MQPALHSAAIAVALLVCPVAVGQVTIPPHSSVYNGYSRGYNFTANTNFFIVQLELPPNAFQAGDTAGFLVLLNGSVALHSIGNAGPNIPTSILVSTGDVVDVIGNWSPATTGNFTAHNSYTATGLTPYATTIEGVAHSLTRCGWQWDIGDPAWNPTSGTGTYLAPVSGQMGRVLMYTSTTSGGTIATNTSLGQGCIRRFTSFYENFATAAAFDLNGLGFSLIPSGSGEYVVANTGTFLPVGSVGTPATLALTNDSEVTVPLTAMGSFPAATGAVAALTVCSNGFVSTAAGNGTTPTPVVATMLSAPQTSWRVWHDYNPAAAGSGPVQFEQNASLTMVTWNGVRNFGGTTAADDSTFQLQFFANGTVVYAFQTMAATGNGYLVGYSKGGASLDPGNSDLSALGGNVIQLSSTDNVPLSLAATTRPVLGTNWNLQVGSIPATTVFGVTIFGASDPGIPDLFFLGMPTCQLRANLDVVVGPWLPAGATFSYGGAIPATPMSLIGFEVFTQAATFGMPPVNAFGAITSNGIKGTLGDL